MSPSRSVDAIVVGLGAMGSAVTLRLAERGLNVIGLDRFCPPHDRGSTHGQTRITRLALGEGAEYVPFARRSHELWRELERAAGTKLLHQNGGLVLGRRDDPFLELTRETALRFEVEHRNLSNHELTVQYPMFNAPADTEAYFEPEAGFLRPEDAVAAQLSLARRAGAQLRFGEAVVAWTANTSGVNVTTGTDTLEARELAFCAGAWITKCVPQATALFAIHQQQLHWFPIRHGYTALRDMPVFIWEMAGSDDPFAHFSGGFYGFPAIDGSDGGVKLATERYDSTVDPDDRPDVRFNEDAGAFYTQYLARYFPWVGREPLHSASCLYTNARGSRFVIDRHPDHPNVMIVAACSGHGFKHSAAIGEAVAQTIVSGSSDIDLAPFAIPDGGLR